MHIPQKVLQILTSLPKVDAHDHQKALQTPTSMPIVDSARQVATVNVPLPTKVFTDTPAFQSEADRGYEKRERQGEIGITATLTFSTIAWICIRIPKKALDIRGMLIPLDQIAHVTVSLELPQDSPELVSPEEDEVEVPHSPRELDTSKEEESLTVEKKMEELKVEKGLSDPLFPDEKEEEEEVSHSPQ
ncbi:hypothetical protein AMTR_s00018p00254650, partial [Amborella trichopoda]